MEYNYNRTEGFGDHLPADDAAEWTRMIVGYADANNIAAMTWLVQAYPVKVRSLELAPSIRRLDNSNRSGSWYRAIHSMGVRWITADARAVMKRRDLDALQALCESIDDRRINSAVLEVSVIENWFEAAAYYWGLGGRINNRLILPLVWTKNTRDESKDLPALERFIRMVQGEMQYSEAELRKYIPSAALRAVFIEDCIGGAERLGRDDPSRTAGSMLSEVATMMEKSLR